MNTKLDLCVPLPSPPRSHSLPRYNVVPQKVLDTELKRTFAHFNEGRIPVSPLH